MGKGECLKRVKTLYHFVTAPNYNYNTSEKITHKWIIETWVQCISGFFKSR